VKKTGININELSEKQYIVETVSTLWENMEMAKNKQPMPEAELNDMRNLIERIEYANAKGVYNEVFALTMNFSQIVDKNGGFFHNNKQYSLEDYEYDGQKYLLPVRYMDDMQQQAISLLDNINKDYPVFNKLPSDLQVEVLSSAFLINLEKRYDRPYQNPLQTCIQDAGLACTAALTLATVSYTISLANCSAYVIPWAIGACLIVNTVIYAAACYSAYDTYNTKVENCNFRYGN
jgi:hypothetical protein